MSIRLLQPIFIAGVLSPVDGSTLSLSAALEADLVNQGKAVWVAAPELTASELAHASAHARMRPPNGVPIILAQSAIQMILPSSGTMGANGSLTGLTALPYSAFPQPCFMYFPAGKVFSGSPAGMYYASLTSATAATVYNNMYTSGRPQDAIPVVPTPVVDAGPGAYTQTTGAGIVLVAVTVPGGLMGPNGRLYVTSDCLANNTAGVKALACRVVGTSTIFSSGLASWLTQRIHGYLSNAGVENRNFGMTNLSGGQGFGTGSFSQRNQNTAVDFVVDITGQITTDTDFIVLAANSMLVYSG